MNCGAKKNMLFAFVIFVVLMLFPISFSAWVITGETTPEITDGSLAPEKSNSEPVAYVQEENKYFTSIEGAVTYANKLSNGAVVVVIPPKGECIYPQDAGDGKADIDITQTVCDKVTYDINYNFTIGEKTTLMIPYKAFSGTVEDYLKTEKVGTRVPIGDSILYKKNKDNQYLDSSGNVTTDKSKAAIRYNFHNLFANEHDNLFLRTTIKVHDNVQINNKGKIVIGGMLSGGSGGVKACGQVSHSYCKIELGTNSKIIQTGSNAELYSFGYITESAANNGSKIEIQSGSLYMPFVLRDFRGGTITIAIGNSMESSGAAPFNLFEFRNVEPLVEFWHGSHLYANANLYTSGKTIAGFIQIEPQENNTQIQFFGDGTNGTDFLQSLDDHFRLRAKYTKPSGNIDGIGTNHCSFYGNLTVNSMSLKFSVPAVGEQTTNTKDTVFPLSNLYSFDFYQGIDKNQKIDNVDLTKIKTYSSVINTKNQMMKIMTGCTVTIHEGVELQASKLITYTAYKHGGSAFSYAGDDTNKKYNCGGSYSNDSSGRFYLYGKLTADVYGGLIIKETNAVINVKTKGMNNNEAYYADTSASLPTSYKIREFNVVKEGYEEVLYSDFSSSKVLSIGFVNLSSHKIPNVSFTGAFSFDSTDGVNKTILIPKENESNEKCSIKQNVSKAQKNGSSYSQMSSFVPASGDKFYVWSSPSDTGNQIMDGLTIDGIHECILGSQIELTPKPKNANVYTKSYKWVVSDNTIGSISQKSGKTYFNGKKIGTTKVKAITNDGQQFESDEFEITVIGKDTLKSFEFKFDDTIKKAGDEFSYVAKSASTHTLSICNLLGEDGGSNPPLDSEPEWSIVKDEGSLVSFENAQNKGTSIKINVKKLSNKALFFTDTKMCEFKVNVVSNGKTIVEIINFKFISQ